MTDDLQHLFYVSTSIDTLEENDIRDILTVARAFNPLHSITGLLIYSGGHFAQILEGPEPELERLMTMIRRDRRHRNVRTLLSAPLARRQFEGWSMGFLRDLSAADLLADLSAAPVVAARAFRVIDLLFRRAELELLS